MKSLYKHVSYYAAALALATVPLLVAPNLATAQDIVPGPTVFNPPPCDYSDTFYQDNGLDPTQVIGRFGTARMTGPPATGSQVNWVADPQCSVNDPDRRDFRILATTGGFADNDTTAPNQFISILGFVANQTAFETTYSRTVGTGGGTIGGSVGPGNTISISGSQNPRGIAMQDIVSNFEAYAMVKQRLPNGTFATNPCQADVASPLGADPTVPGTPCFELNNVNTVFTPNLRQDWRFASNRNAMDGSDNNCLSADPTICAAQQSPFGYFCDDLLGMWIITYVWYTQDPLHPTSQACADAFKALFKANGTSLDGTPIIKTFTDTNDTVEGNNCGAEGQLNPNGNDLGAIWLVCPAIPDPRNGAIAKDAFLDSVHNANGTPQNPQMTANFVALQTTGEFPNNGNGQ